MTIRSRGPVRFHMRFTSSTRRSPPPPTPEEEATAKLLLARLINDANGRYNGLCPARITCQRSTVLHGSYEYKCEVPGQPRTVLVKAAQMKKVLLDQTVYEEVRDEVLYAIFLLLDEDEDEE